MPTTITLLARKGGVGKTMLSASIAGDLARRGAQVLCIDLDGQASLSRFFFGSEHVERLSPQTTAAAVISDYGSDPEEVIHETPIKGIFIVPSCDALDKLATPAIPKDVMTIRRMIAEVADRFDVVLIDTPPNTNVATTLSGIVAADFVLSTVAADAFGTQSIISVQRAVGEAVRYQPNLRILGYVLNQLQHNGVNDAYVKMVRQLHGQQVLTTEIPLAVGYREAMSLRMPISQYKPKLKPAKVIAALVDEINERIESTTSRKKVA